MKILILTFVLVCLSSTTALAAPAAKNRLAWSFLYGQGSNKNEFDYTPTGPAYKIMFGARMTNFDINLQLRYVKMSDDITYAGTDGNIKNRNVAAGIHFGYWVFSFLNLHVGYAKHMINQDLSGSYTTKQVTELNTKYGIEEKDTGGLYTGVDLVLLQSNSFQFFVNGDYYRLNQMEAHDWEVLGGFRFYFDATSSGESLFTKIFQKIFSPK